MPRPPPPVHWGNKYVTIAAERRRASHPVHVLNKYQRARLKQMIARAKANPPGPHPRIALAMTNPHGVQKGQVWINIDNRAGKHWKAGAPAVLVWCVQPPYAFCYWVDLDGNLDLEGPMKTSRIRLDAFRQRESKRTRYGGGNRGWRLKE